MASKWLFLALVIILLAGCHLPGIAAQPVETSTREAAPTAQQAANTQTPDAGSPTDDFVDPTAVPTEARQAVTGTPTPGSESTDAPPEKDGDDNSERLREIDGMPMSFIAAGDFIMGSNRYKFESPQRTVYLDAYWIDQFEVSNAQYSACEAAGACSAPFTVNAHTIRGYYTDPDYANFPMVSVNWHQAQAYCQWAGGRLPSEAEWEKAARGTDGRTYPWGDDYPGEVLLNFDDNIGELVAVGSYPMGVSPYGVHDMAGNAKEWTADWWQSDYYQDAPDKNPTGPVSGDRKVVRNGCYGHSADIIRAPYRNYFAPGNSGNYLGFRCVLPAAAP